VREYCGARLIYIPLKANGWQSVFYDMLSLIFAIFFSDIILILGISGCILLPFIKLLCKKTIILHVDGLEWKRSKWNSIIKKFLLFSEKLGVKFADKLISDNQYIMDYLEAKYGRKSELIAYGGDHAKRVKISDEIKARFPFLNKPYALCVARIEPENNIHLILEAFKDVNLNIVIIGNWKQNKYAKRLMKKYKRFKNIFMIESIYDVNVLDQIRSNCFIYIHGHSVGGTNPSLVEAMFLGLPIVAYNCVFNRATTGNLAIYFSTSEELKNIVKNLDNAVLSRLKSLMYNYASSNYRWTLIVKKYEDIFKP
jgi:glycosyltransferase involved in cell wall biosynthesis